MRAGNLVAQLAIRSRRAALSQVTACTRASRLDGSRQIATGWDAIVGIGNGSSRVGSRLRDAANRRRRRRDFAQYGARCTAVVDCRVKRPESVSSCTFARVRVSSLGFRTDLGVLALEGSEIVDRGDHLVVRSPSQPSYFWGNFVLVPSPLGPGDATRWLAVFSEAFEEASHVAIGIDAKDGKVGDVAELYAAGLTVEAGTVLCASSLQRPGRPEATAELRPLVSNEDWAQVLRLGMQVALEEGRGFAEDRHFHEGRVAAARRLAATGRGAYFGAFLDGRLCSSLGLVLQEDGLARFRSVMTNPGHRRRGLASALVYAAGRHGLDDLGASRLVIAADPDGPAIGLYRSLGFVATEHHVLCERAPL